MNGNTIKILFLKIRFFLLKSEKKRTKWIYKHKNLFHSIGENLFFQPRKLPADPELISFGNNVYVASDVTFVNHDIIGGMLNNKYKTKDFCYYRAPISIGDNVMIGTHVVILPNVKIGNNVIIGAGSIVTKDISDDSVVAGVPAKVVGSFNDFVEKRRGEQNRTTAEIWRMFEKR